MNRQAMEFDSKSGSFSPQEYALPQPQPGEVLIRVTFCTICGSDLHTFEGRRQAPPACVLGHEIIGEIVNWGAGATPQDFFGKPISQGQRVTWCMAVGCGKCFFCQHGLSQKCESLFKYGHASQAGGPRGGLSQHCLLTAGTPIFPLPNELPDEVAGPSNCATATVAAAQRLVSETHTIQDSTILITGAGMLGLNAAAQAAEAGAREIIVVDPLPERRTWARRFGATACFDTDNFSALESHLARMTDGRGADIALEFAGFHSAVEMCLHHIRTGGCVLLAGSVFPGDEVRISPEQIIRRMITLRGLHNYLATDLEAAIQFLKTTVHKYPFQALVSKTFPLDQTKAAFEYAVESKPIRVAIRP